MDGEDISRAVNRLVTEILDANRGADDLVIIGIRTRGVPLAGRIVKTIQELEKKDVETGVLDITLYRDDIGLTDSLPVVKKTDIPFNIFNKTLVLVDDVLFTGRTVRAALDAVVDFGRPRKIQLCVLVDRGNREFPIRADFVAKKITTRYEDEVEVLFAETDGEDKVFLREK